MSALPPKGPQSGHWWMSHKCHKRKNRPALADEVRMRASGSTEPMSAAGNDPAAEVERPKGQLGFRLPNKPSVSPFGPAVK